VAGQAITMVVEVVWIVDVAGLHQTGVVDHHHPTDVMPAMETGTLTDSTGMTMDVARAPPLATMTIKMTAGVAAQSVALCSKGP